MLFRSEYELTPREGGDEHEKRGLWRVEIREEPVYGPEAVTGIDEDPRASGAGLELAGTAIDPGAVVGSRDRSWGVRNVGERVQLGAPLNAAPQFYWLWAPVCFDGFGTMFDINEYGDGERWHHSGAVLDGT